MGILVWLLIPLAATLLGLLWVSWRHRDRKPADAVQGMEDMARFRQAMERPLPPLQRGRPLEDESDESRPLRDTGPAA